MNNHSIPDSLHSTFTEKQQLDLRNLQITFHLKQNEELIGTGPSTSNQIINKQMFSKKTNDSVTITGCNSGQSNEENNTSTMIKKLASKTDQNYSQGKNGCLPYCKCSACLKNGYTNNLILENSDQQLWKGTVIYNFNQSNYLIANTVLNYGQFGSNLSFDKLYKVKYFFDRNMRISLLKFVDQCQTQTKQTVTFVNKNQIQGLFTKIVIAHINNKYKIWMKPTQFQQTIEGTIYKKVSILGKWQRKRVKIQANKISEEGGQFTNLNSFGIWTNFQFINPQILYLIVKIWDGPLKIEYALPVNQLYSWLIAFLTLLKTSN